MEKLFFDNQDNLLRIALTSPVIYAIVILYIRLVGKRATSQMNSFDWIVTVAMGSLVASTIILKDVSIIEGALAIFLLLLMQYILTKLMVHSDGLRKLVRSTPQLLVYNGEFLMDNMASERIVKNEILSAIRHRGIQNIGEVHAVV
ncbi:MAG: YetF domain-containing protein, partial [Cyclobacteriaceae bacterium]